MSEIPFDLTTLMPKESHFILSTFPEKKFTLCRWSLRVRAWAVEKYSTEGLKEIFEKVKIGEIADLTWYMLKDEDKASFPKGYDDFLDSVVTTKDQIAIVNALLGAVGIGEPEIKKIKESLEPNQKKTLAITKTKKNPKKTRGSTSSTR